MTWDKHRYEPMWLFYSMLALYFESGAYSWDTGQKETWM